MSAEYFWFTACYALVLVFASLAVFTHRGQRTVLSAMRRMGIVLGLGAFGLLRTFGYRLEAKGLSPVERAGMAESYIAEAEVQTLLSARVTVWVLISGCVFTALSGGTIAGILPRSSIPALSRSRRTERSRRGWSGSTSLAVS